MKKISLLVVELFFIIICSAQTTSTFDDLPLGPDTCWTGSTFSGGFSDGNAYFENQYDTAGGHITWGGFVYSDKTDSTTPGNANQYSAITARGYGGSNNYVIAHDSSGDGNVRIRLTGNAMGKTVGGFYITNTTDAYLSMLNGGQSENAFDTSNEDFFLLKITGWYQGIPIEDTVNFYLADYRDSDGIVPYIIKDWQWISLLELGNVDSLVFSLYSSQNYYDTILNVSGGDSIINVLYSRTPAFFAMDNFVTSNLPTLYDTLQYDQDTLINVIEAVGDTTGGPYTIQFISNTIYGSSVAIDSQNLMFYVPEQGVVGADTVTYVICNSSGQCDTGIIVFYCESPSGIKQINTLQVKVYPNPFNNSFSVYHSGDVKTIALYDMEGRLIRETPCTTGELVTGIKADNLSAGVYIVKVISDSAVGIAKITRQ